MLLTFLFNSVNRDATHALAEEKEMTCNLVVLASAVTLYICIKLLITLCLVVEKSLSHKCLVIDGFCFV